MLGQAFANTVFFFCNKNDLPGNRRLLRKALVFINTSSAILHEYQVAFFPPIFCLQTQRKTVHLLHALTCGLFFSTSVRKKFSGFPPHCLQFINQHFQLPTELQPNYGPLEVHGSTSTDFIRTRNWLLKSLPIP